MNDTARRSLGVALICTVLLVVVVMVNQLSGASVVLDLIGTVLMVAGLGALFLAGVALARRR